LLTQEFQARLQQHFLNKKLDFLVVFIVVLGMLAAGILFMRAFPVDPDGTIDVAVPRVVEGTHLPALSVYRWNSHSTTLVLALRVGCPYCAASMGFYERLHELEKRRAITVHLVAIFAEKAEEVKKEMPESLHDLETLAGVDLRELSIRATPTVLLVDANGIARRIWRGQLSPELENQVLLATQAGPLR